MSPSGGEYKSGLQITLTATPASGYTFDHWTGGASGTTPTVTITMDSDTSLTANFKPTTQTYTLTTSVSPSGAGSVSPSSGEYESGALVTVTATPASGYTFDYWSGSASGTTSTITITMNSHKSLTANFKVRRAPINWSEIGVPYEAADGLTVTLQSFDIVEKTGSYQYIITYTLTNEIDSAIDEGQFKLYYEDEPGGLPQYGFFGRLFPGDELTRSYTFEEEKHITFGVLAYHHDQFFADSPPANALQWHVEY